MALACTHLALLLSSLLLLLPLASTEDVGEEKVTEAVVEGMVYCQSCEHLGTWSLTGAKPIPSAKVSVVCENHQGQVSFYRAYETDANGYFYAPLQGFNMTSFLLDHPLQSCHAKLFSSPLADCNVLSNINFGMYGAPLHYDRKRLQGKNYEAVIYATGPLAFCPSHCPATTHN